RYTGHRAENAYHSRQSGRRVSFWPRVCSGEWLHSYLFLLSPLLERVGHSTEHGSYSQFTYPLHHFFHFHELFHESINVSNRGSASLGDPSTPTAVQDGRIAPLAKRHGINNRLHALDLLFGLFRINLVRMIPERPSLPSKPRA